MPRAYLLTWTTYGTWLPGDDRGSTSHARDGHAATRLKPQPLLVRSAEASMKHQPVVFDDEVRSVVASSIASLAAKKDWKIWAISVRTNHVHLVVTAEGEPGRVMAECKAVATKWLREAGMVSQETTVWTRHGSTRWIHTGETLKKAIRYTNEQDLPRRS